MSTQARERMINALTSASKILTIAFFGLAISSILFLIIGFMTTH